MTGGANLSRGGGAAAPLTAVEQLPDLRGRIQFNAPLAPFTWFRAGGHAEALVRPADADDLARFLAALPDEIPVHVIGSCSNLIVRDGGLPGVTIRLARGFSRVRIDGTSVQAGAAALDITVAEHAAAASLTGLEFMSGIPGSVGGAVAMNAGAYGGEIAGALDWADIVTRSGERRRLFASDLRFGYRHANIPPASVVIAARFHAQRGAPAVIAARMREILALREASQPVRARTGGSTFRNPDAPLAGLSGGRSDGVKAWELIDAAGCRGLRLGGAQVSEKHCNFLINTGGATAADIEALGEEVRRRVKATTGVTLEWEIRRIGIPRMPPPTLQSEPAS
jgi:UDP-N-acetylmuramate dehydrogenase